MTGLERIAAAFARARQENRAALMPYFTLGFPTRKVSLETIQAIAAAGADLIELGLPFSDPLADGPTIQHSTQVALDNGASTADCLDMVKELRQAGVTQPFLLMGYANPILNYGIDKFVEMACRAGADGLIIPDLPVDEGQLVETACSRQGMALVYMVAPTTPAERLAAVARHSTGFLYIVSLTGVTGAREQVSTGLSAFLERVRAVADKPLAVGFGISTPAQAAEVGKMAEGVIVGSALIDAAGKAANPPEAAKIYVRSLYEATRDGTQVHADPAD